MVKSQQNRIELVTRPCCEPPGFWRSGLARRPRSGCPRTNGKTPRPQGKTLDLDTADRTSLLTPEKEKNRENSTMKFCLSITGSREFATFREEEAIKANKLLTSFLSTNESKM